MICTAQCRAADRIARIKSKLDLHRSAPLGHVEVAIDSLLRTVGGLAVPRCRACGATPALDPACPRYVCACGWMCSKWSVLARAQALRGLVAWNLAAGGGA